MRHRLIRSPQVDGMDLLTVREAIRFARDWCLSGKGPLLLETETYRYYGHSMSDPGTSYRTREEVQSMRRSRDPITLFQKRVGDAQLCTQDEMKVSGLVRGVLRHRLKLALECAADTGVSNSRSYIWFDSLKREVTSD